MAASRRPNKQAKQAPPAGPAIDVQWVADKVLSRVKQPKAGRDWPIAVAVAIGGAIVLVLGGAAWVAWTILAGPAPAVAAEQGAHEPAAASGAPAQTSAAATEAPAPTEASSAQVISAPSLGPQTPEQIVTAQKETAEDVLKASLPESRSLTYRDVRTYVKGPVQTNPVVFCGEVDSLNPAGGHVGYQHFISSADHAQVETMMTPGDFDQAWRDRCAGDQGPKVWR